MATRCTSDTTAEVRSAPTIPGGVWWWFNAKEAESSGNERRSVGP